jgi:hypothetical protein
MRRLWHTFPRNFVTFAHIFLLVASYHKKTFSYVRFTPEKTDVVDADAPKKLQVGFLLSEYRFLA